MLPSASNCATRRAQPSSGAMALKGSAGAELHTARRAERMASFWHVNATEGWDEMRRRILVTATAALAALLGGAAPASALTIHSTPGGDRFFVDGAGAANENLRVAVTGRAAVITAFGVSTLTIGANFGSK
jgi:hypothetical protein